MKISIVTGVWKRPDVFRLFAQGIKNLNYDLRVIVAGSEGFRSRRMVESEGFEYIEIRNFPLSAKMNATTRAAKGSDYVICMGSDDILSPHLFKVYLEHMGKGVDLIGLEDLYFYDIATKRSLYWAGYRGERKGKTTGVARCLSKKTMEMMDWHPWGSHLNRYLDASMDKHIKQIRLKKIINLKREGLMAVDVKNRNNLTKFDKWDNSEYIDSTLIKKHFPYLP